MPDDGRALNGSTMPMIDVYAAAGTFSDKNRLAQDLARAVMRWEAVPEIPLFADNTAAFIHDLPAEAISTAAGRSDYVRVQVLTPAGVLDRDKQLGVVKELTEIVAQAGRRPGGDRSGAGPGSGCGRRSAACSAAAVRRPFGCCSGRKWSVRCVCCTAISSRAAGWRSFAAAVIGEETLM